MLSISIKTRPLGDSALVLNFGNVMSDAVNRRVHQATGRLREARLPGIVDLVPAFASLTVFYDGCLVTYTALVEAIEMALTAVEESKVSPGRVIELPTCYEPPYSSDIQQVAEHCQCTVEDVVALHSEPEYQVYFLGFMPGFPYLGGMSPALATPRKTTPVLTVPAGAVGIAGGQTGVYPMETPGGWQIIGRTPIPLFVPGLTPPAVLRAGDRLRFKPVSACEFEQWRQS